MKRIQANILFISLLTTVLFAQNEKGILLRTGYGYYETITAGLGFNLNDVHFIGITAGSSFMMDAKMYYAVGIEDNIALFRQKKDNKDNFKWFLTNKILYWDMEDDYYRWNVLSLSPSLTRRFSLNKKLSISVDLGPMFNIVLESYRKTYEALGWPYYVMPNSRLLVNYQF